MPNTTRGVGLFTAENIVAAIRAIPDSNGTALLECRVKLDPVALLHAIREAQSALAAVTCPEI